MPSFDPTRNIIEDLTRQLDEARRRATSAEGASAAFRDLTPGSVAPGGQLTADWAPLGGSKWLGIQQRLLGEQKAGALGQVQSGSQSAYAKARSALASRGGLAGGSAERLAADAARQEALGRQDVRSKYTQMGLGLESQAAEKDREAIQKALETKLAVRLGTEAADAQRAAGAAARGGGLCFITTAACEYLGLPDDNALLNAFRKFRDEFMGGKEGVKKYYEIAPKIVEKIKQEDKVDSEMQRILVEYLLPCYHHIKLGELKKTEELYTKMVLDLEEKYLKE